MQLSLIVPPTVTDWHNYTKLLPGHFCIASVAIKHEGYKAFFKAEAKRGAKVILDNGVFEEDLIANEDLIELAWEIGAHTLIIPDILCGDAFENKTKAEKFIVRAKVMHSLQATESQSLPKFMFVPQCKLNDDVGFWQSIDWAINNPDIACIGICRDACRNAQMQWTNTDDQELNRFYFAVEAIRTGYVVNAQKKATKWHFLGVGDNVHIIENYWFVDSMDTASLFWQGYHANSIQHGRLLTHHKRPTNYFTRPYIDLIRRGHTVTKQSCFDIVEGNCLEAQYYANNADKLRRKLLGGRI